MFKLYLFWLPIKYLLYTFMNNHHSIMEMPDNTPPRENEENDD